MKIKMNGVLRRVTTLLSTRGPSVGLEIAAGRVTAVALVWVKSIPRLLGHATVPLAEGAVVPSAASTNIIDREAVAAAVRGVLEQLPRRATRVGLIVPDSAAKVSFVHFDEVPERSADLDRLVAWQVRKAVPFRMEEAQLAYTPGATRAGGGRDFVAVIIRRDIVQEYETVCGAAGAQVGLLDVASFNVVNAGLALSPPLHADWLLVHIAPGYCTLAIVRGEHLIFFRNRRVESEVDLADLVHQTAMYYEDRLEGRGFARSVLVDSSDTPGVAHAARQILEERLGTAVEPLASVRATATLGSAATPMDPMAAAIGLVMRERLLSTA